MKSPTVGVALVIFVLGGALACGESGSTEPRPADELRVISIDPARNHLGTARDGDLIVRFDRPLDPASVDQGDLQVFGRWSGMLPGSAMLESGGHALRFTPARPLAAGESVTATLPAGAIRGADGAELSPGHTWTFWAEAAPAAASFEHVATLQVRRPGEGHIRTYGAYAGDLDGDGWSDLVLPNEESNDLRIFLNDGSGSYSDFTIVPVPQGGEPSTNAGADFDGDGDIDFAVGSARGRFVTVYRGDGSGGLIHHQDLEAGDRVRGVCVLDLEGDGDPDLAVTAFGADHVAIWENDGSGNFTAARTIDAGAGEWSCATGDANADGLLDLFIGTRTSLELVVLLPNGNGTFTESDRIFAGGDPWMLGAGDMNGDGRVDVASVNAEAASISVLLGNGEGELALNDTYPLGGFSLAVDLGDLDGDGDLDVVVSDYRTGVFMLWENDGGGRLTRLPADLPAPSNASCAILHDRDNDGDLDISGIDETEDVLILWENG